MNPIKFIANKINRKSKKKYRILTFSTHESYQEAMSRTGHDFFLLEIDKSKKWNESFRELPKNCTIINSFYEIPDDIDFIISQERYSQIQNAKALSNALRLPVIHIDHVEPVNSPEIIATKNLTCDINISITEHNKISWGNTNSIVINHGIDTDIFNNWCPNDSKTVVYIVNYLKDRDFFCGYSEWSYIKDTVNKIDPSIKFILIGDNPGVSKPISNPKLLVKELNSCACYLNTSKFSPIPMSLLEAMSCGMPVVSTRYQEVSKLLNDKNSFSSNNLDELSISIVNICNKNDDYVDMGQSARSIINKKYSLGTFIENWNNVFDQAYNIRLGKVNEIFHI